MSPSQNIKELRQFFGLTDSYRNCINHYGDITNILAKLLKNNEPYFWTDLHQKVFLELKNHLQIPLIVIFLDTNNSYFLFTDASKYCWEATLYQYTQDSDNLDNLRPIMFISGRFSRICYIHMLRFSKMLNAPEFVIRNQKPKS